MRSVERNQGHHRVSLGPARRFGMLIDKVGGPLFRLSLGTDSPQSWFQEKGTHIFASLFVHTLLLWCVGGALQEARLENFEPIPPIASSRPPRFPSPRFRSFQCHFVELVRVDKVTL